METNAPGNNKKLIITVAIILGALLISLIALLVILINKDNEPTVTVYKKASNSQDVNKSEDTTSKPRKVVKTIPGNEEGVELVIYEPVQSASSTTIYIGLKNSCKEDCDSSELIQGYSDFGYAIDSSGTDNKNVYLVDNNASQKYKPITDDKGNVVGTKRCNASLAPGKVFVCSVAFTKVPSGSEVSVFLGGGAVAIDGIKIP